MSKAKNIVKKITEYIMTFLLSITIMLLLITIILKTTILKDSFIKKFLVKIDYYNKTYETINEDFKKYTMQSGFGDNIVENICNKEMVKADINSIIDYVYNNKEISIQANKVSENLEGNIQRYIQEKKYKVTEENKNNIEAFKVSIVNTYKNDIIYIESVSQILNMIIQTLQKTIVPAMMVFTIIAMILVLIIYKMEKKEAIKYISIAVITTIILCVTIKIGFEKYINLEKSIYFIMQGV